MTVLRTFWVVLGLFAVSLFGVAVYGSPLFYRLVYVWGLLLISSWLWTYFALRGIQVRRQARSLRHQVGEIFEERFEVVNESRLFRVWIEVRDESRLPGEGGSRVLTWIGARQQRTYLANSWLNRRGLIPLGPTTLRAGDLFGLFAVTRRFPATQSLLVIPHLVELQRFPSPPGMLPGGRALRRRTTEATPHAAGVREYTPGDALSRIHWPSTARRDQLMVKEFEQDPQSDVWIFIDAQRSVQVSLEEEIEIPHIDKVWLWRHRPQVTLPPATIEYAISAAASIGRYFIQRGQALGIASAGQVFTILPAERGERQLAKMLETLAFLQGEGSLPLIGLVTAQMGHLPRGSTVVLITPSTQPAIELAVELLDQRDMHPIVVLIDPASFGARISSADLAAKLAVRDVPVIQITKGADLKSTLEGGGTEIPYLVRWWAQNEVEEAAQ
jgi:uncharacterized protein (DUF58 family)